MQATTRTAASPLLAGSVWQWSRLASGLVLFAFVGTHLMNHALGLVDIPTMQAWQGVRLAVTRSAAGGTVLLGAFLVHILLALAKLSSRSHLRLPVWELAQLALGLTIPVLLMAHFVSMRVGWHLFNKATTYQNSLGPMWTNVAVMQSIIVVLVWTHGCIGIHYWLRLSARYRTVQPLLLAIAVALPLLALAGFSVAGRESSRLNAAAAASKAQPGAASRDGYGDAAPVQRCRDGYCDPVPAQGALVGESQVAALERYETYGLVLFLSLAGLAFASIAARALAPRFLGLRALPTVTIDYLDGPRLRLVPGPTLLETSRSHGVPHTSICGGRARCSTCRVRVLSGLEHLPPPGDAERATLARIGAGPDVRLACQIRPTAPLRIARIVPPDAPLGQSAPPPEQHGVERTCAVLFLDVRGFTRFSQAKLPYDVVFVLNRLFQHLGAAIEAEGGWIDKYMGDGLMAVFGREVPPAEACRQALAAARALDLALEAANATLTTELGEPVRIGIGIHAGPVVIGTIGHDSSAALTVIGRTVNAAARLEQSTKDEGVQLIVSAETLRLAGAAAPAGAPKRLAIRGMDEALDVVLIARARDWPPATL